VRLVAEDCGQEDDRRAGAALARSDQFGGLEAVHPRHVQVEQDHRELFA
jgi:hypothetical protein